MDTSNSKFCRICLSSNKEDNVVDSTNYMKTFIHIMDTKELQTLWLCMWCRTTLKKTQDLIKLASQSEKVLCSQNEISDTIFQPKRPSTLSYHTIKHIDIPPEHREDFEKPIIILNVDDQFKEDDEMLHAIDNVNEVYLENDFINDNLNEIDINEKSDMSKDNKELESHINEIDIKVLEVKHENELDDIMNEIDISTGKKRKCKYETKMKLNENRIELKLEELKFEVRYLNLEEQLEELEKKKLKYKHMKFQCDLCGVGFQTNDYFEEHKLRHTMAFGRYQCNICHLYFKTSLVLSQHTLSHRRVFTCATCGATRSKWSNCRAHRHKCGAAVARVKCGKCRKIFSDEHTLKVHQRIHDMRKRFTCEQCGRQFRTKQRLVVHTRSHSGEKPFSCTECGRCFATQSNLVAHGSVHATTASHYCVECDTSYKTAKGLKRHLAECSRHVRDRSNLFSCKQCCKEFSTEKALQTHVARHSISQEVVCPHCDKTFSNKSNLNKHLKCIHRETNA